MSTSRDAGTPRRSEHAGEPEKRQERALPGAGYRVIRYDRRGFGNSSRPTTGYDYDTFAADLNALLELLGPDDVVLAGFSMGTGEVTRYLGTYGSERVRRAVLFGVIPPFLLKTDDNPDGVDGQVFEGIKAAVLADRYAYFKDFLDNFYNVDKLAPERISEQAWQASFNVAARRLSVRVVRVRRHVADGLPRRSTEDRRSHARAARHRGPDPALRVDGEAAARSRRGFDADPGRRRSTQHRLDEPGRMQRSDARLPRRRSSERTAGLRRRNCNPDSLTDIQPACGVACKRAPAV
jgi:pimeloyl-ACP methyl ester carboxylesterase